MRGGHLCAPGGSSSRESPPAGQEQPELLPPLPGLIPGAPGLHPEGPSQPRAALTPPPPPPAPVEAAASAPQRRRHFECGQGVPTELGKKQKKPFKSPISTFNRPESAKKHATPQHTQTDKLFWKQFVFALSKSRVLSG